MSHWADFLCFAVCHAEAMKYAQIAIDPMAVAQAMQAAAAQQARVSSLVSGPFDSRLISGR